MKLIVEIPDRIIADLKAKRGVDIADTDLVFGALTAGKPYEERQTGEWLMEDGYKFEQAGCYCSNCKTRTFNPAYYCSYCGTDMRSENKFQDLVVFDDQPKRQLEDPDCHNEL